MLDVIKKLFTAPDEHDDGTVELRDKQYLRPTTGERVDNRVVYGPVTSGNGGGGTTGTYVGGSGSNTPLAVTFDAISRIIISNRMSELIGKGKFTADEHLAESLFMFFRHVDAENKALTFERIAQAIEFVKSNEIMGAGKWTKEEHLTEYLYSLWRLSKLKGVGSVAASSLSEAKEGLSNLKHSKQQQPSAAMHVS